MKKYVVVLALFAVVFGCSVTAFATDGQLTNNEQVVQIETVEPMGVIDPTETAEQAKSTKADWIDSTRQSTKRWLNGRARVMDNWFGETDPNKPATASLRFMLDYHHDEMGEVFKPKVRGRLRLPALENRLSLMIGDDGLDDELMLGRQGEVVAGEPRLDRERVRQDNGSLALRLSRWSKSKKIDSDIDIGVRSADEIYVRLHAKKDWQQGDNINSYVEQIYRYGSESEHYARSNFNTTWQRSPNRSLTYHAYLDYTHKGDETLTLGHQLYQSHTSLTRLGRQTWSYGVQVSEVLSDGVAVNRHGVFAHYRQPIFKDWLFIQSELNFYNDRVDDKGHRLASFVRLEAVF